jgi:hypothetical protein
MDFAFIVLTIAATLTPLRDPVFGTDAGVNFGRDLVWSNRYGSFDRFERAAFIVDRGNGELECIVWQLSNERERATFRGAIPAGTIAIIHTHPFNMPWPSDQDEKEAHRLGIPIYALTPLTVTKAEPAEPRPLLVRKGAWLDPRPAEYRCKHP